MQYVQELFTIEALPFFNLISDAGTGAPFVIFLLTLFLVFGTKVGLRAGLFYSFASYCTFVLKWLIAAPRPYFIDPNISAHSLSTGYGMPSGHAAQTSAGLWPAILARKSLILSFAMLAFVLLVALARVYLGVHFPYQVIAGLILGTFVFASGYLLEDRVVRLLKASSAPVQIILLLAPLILFYAIDRKVISTMPENIPANWQAAYDRAVEVRGLELGYEASSAEVVARKEAFTLTEARSNEFYAGFLGWLIAGFAALRLGTFEVTGWRHAAANLALGSMVIGALFGVFFGILGIEVLQLLLISVAPLICAFAIPTITQYWFTRAPSS